MKLYCPDCKKEVDIRLVYHAEKHIDTTDMTASYDDIDFDCAECPDCYYNFGDEIDIPEDKKQEFLDLVKRGWSII